MNANEIERALRTDETIEPSSDFTARVMVSVRRQTGEREAIAFPWARLLPGLLGCLVVTTVGLAIGPPPAVPEAAMRILENPAAVQAITWIPTALVWLWALIWTSMRLAGARR